MSAPTQPRTAMSPLLDLLRTVLARCGEVVIRPMESDRFLGLTIFAERAIYLREGQDDAQFLETLIHELHHLALGPVERHLAGAAEEHVVDATAGTLAAMGEQAR